MGRPGLATMRELWWSLMLVCPTCEDEAEEKVHIGASRELASGPPIRVCHSSDGVYIHVQEGDSQ